MKKLSNHTDGERGIERIQSMIPLVESLVDHWSSTMIFRVGRSELAVGRSELAVGRSELAVGRSELAVGSSELAVGSSELDVHSWYA